MIRSDPIRRTARYIREGTSLTNPPPSALDPGQAPSGVPERVAPGITVERDIRLTMRDSAELVLDLYLPEVEEPLPTLLLAMPYGKDLAQSYTYAHPLWWVRRGYAVAVQDTRGRFGSGGDFYPLRNDAEDGVETVMWLASQPFSNGSVATYGFSYAGLSQLLLAALQPSALAAIAPAFCASGMYGAAYTGGALSLGTMESWAVHLAVDEAVRRDDWALVESLMAAERGVSELYLKLPLREFEPLHTTRTSSFFFDYVEHPRREAFWAPTQADARYGAIEIPALHIGGWYDTFASHTVARYERMVGESSAVQRLLMGPWYHMPWTQLTGELDFGSEARNVIDEYSAVWFDHWLRGDPRGEPDLPPVRLFIMGINEWRDEDEWPLARARTERFYLASDGRANSLSGSGALVGRPEGSDYDVFVYNPLDPVPSRGGKSCCWAETSPMGPKDERSVEVRNDVLVYTGEPLERPVEVTGTISATVYASSNAPDTDFTVKLVDVHPCGRAMYLTDGILRARFRDGVGLAPDLEVGEVYEFTIDVGVTSNVFLAGHRIQVAVSSSNFPMYDRNPNSGNEHGTDRLADVRPATQIVWHNERYPSHISLPIVPAR